MYVSKTQQIPNNSQAIQTTTPQSIKLEVQRKTKDKLNKDKLTATGSKLSFPIQST